MKVLFAQDAPGKRVWETSPAALIGKKIPKPGESVYDPANAAKWRSAAGRDIVWKNGKPYYKDTGESAE